MTRGMHASSLSERPRARPHPARESSPPKASITRRQGYRSTRSRPKLVDRPLGVRFRKRLLRGDDVAGVLIEYRQGTETPRLVALSLVSRSGAWNAFSV